MGAKVSKRGRRRRRGSAARGQGWQLWAVVVGVALVVAAFFFALTRRSESSPVEIDGTVVAKEVSTRPGQLDRFHLRRLTIEDGRGERATLEVSEEVFDLVEEGFSLSRGPDGAFVVRDPDGRVIGPAGPAAREPGGG